MSEKKTHPHTTWLDDDLNHFVAIDALERCQSVSDYFRSLAEKRRDEKRLNSVSNIDVERISADLIRLAKELVR